MNESTNEGSKTVKEEFFLLKATVGPVQEFITEARKTRDLYMGSNLLSQATWHSMKPIFEIKNGCDLIYPYLENTGILPDYPIPNMYMAITPKDNLDGVVQQMEDSLREFWKYVDHRARDKIPDFSNWERLWNNQIHDHFYINWVAIPIGKEELSESYRSKVKDVQKFLDERKMTRTFEQWDGDNEYKCFQCGHRERMPEDLFSKLKENKEIKMRLKDKERLCAVCLLKRILNESDLNKSDIELAKVKLESVSDVAASPFKQLVLENKDERVIKNFLLAVNCLRKSMDIAKVDGIEKLGGEWYYKEFFSYKYLKKEYGFVEKTQDPKNFVKNAENSLKEVLKNLGKEPCKYYTILNMDGDDMGKLMSGDSLSDKEFTISYHKGLSQMLSETGKNLKNLIEEKKEGYCVYSGGDDILAFLPLRNSLQMANQIRSSFNEGFKDLSKKPTISAGIVILHHHDPLQKGLMEARRSVEEAKKWFREKDAFFITLRVFSGSVINWSSKWTIEDLKIQREDSSIDLGHIEVLHLLEEFVSMMTAEPKNRLSPSFVRDLMRELPAFYKYNEYKNKWSFIGEMFKTRFKRLFLRHTQENSILRTELWDNQQNNPVSKLDLITEAFAFMADPDMNKEMKGDKNRVRDNFEHFLQIALFLARENSEEVQ